jgi:hypothetical protein
MPMGSVDQESGTGGHIYFDEQSEIKFDISNSKFILPLSGGLDARGTLKLPAA